MSSYAGSIASLDDYYLLGSGLAVTETSLFVYNRYYRNLLIIPKNTNTAETYRFAPLSKFKTTLGSSTVLET